MGNFSRDTFKLTNLLYELSSGSALPSPRFYTGVRLQQGVPLVDADWNESEDIRKFEMSMIVANAIGNGVPSGSDGFRIQQAGVNNNFAVEKGLLLLDGWLIYNKQKTDYAHQPHRTAGGVSPTVPDIQNAAQARRDLVYLDVWETEIDSGDDASIVDTRIGIETSVRQERVWVVRTATIQKTADPLDPALIPGKAAGHHYYPVAYIDRPAGGQITDAMITDIRRTSLTLSDVTHAPLFLSDTVRNQQLDSKRLATMFTSYLSTMRAVLLKTPEILYYQNHDAETLIAFSAYQDVRSMAATLGIQAMGELLHAAYAFGAMNSFYQVQKDLMTTISTYVTKGYAPASADAFVNTCTKHLDGNNANDASSFAYAIKAGDLLGTVLAQERMNEELSQTNDTLPEGTVTVSLVSITPTGALKDKTQQAFYQLTIRISNNLTSNLGSEDIRAVASAGAGWTLAFQASTQPNKRETVEKITNQKSKDVVLMISADPGAAATTLNLSVRPERRQQLVYNLPAVPMALGQELIPSQVIASLTYQGPVVPASIPRAAMFSGISLPFRVDNLSASAEQYKISVTPLSTATGWQPPAEPVLAAIPSGQNRTINITFKTTDKDNAVSPLTYRLQLVRVTGGANETLAYTKFDITFTLA